MQISSRLTQLFDSTGPFATVYLDATRGTDDSPDVTGLRWRAARESLAASGADAATLDALEPAAVGPTGVGGPHGRMLVGAGGQVLFSGLLPAPPRRELQIWAPLPHLMPYLAESAPRIAHVVVIADRSGADVLTVPADAAQSGVPGRREAVEGSAQHPLHATGRDDWGERHFQNRVHNAWDANARDVAERVAHDAREIRAELVIVAGEDRARALLRDDLPGALPAGVRIEDISEGGRAAGASSEALAEAVTGMLLQERLRRTGEVLDRLGAGRSHGLAVDGLAAVVGALEQAAVDTAVLADDPSSTTTAWIGPEPLQLAGDAQTLRDLGVADPVKVRFDAALVRALAGSDAAVVTVSPESVTLSDGIAATLRFPAAPTG